MRKSILAFTLLFSVAIFTQSCKKDDANAEDRIIRATIKKNQSFQHDFGLAGYEDGSSITRQAKHFIISESGRDDSNRIIYKYQPSTNYVGTDEVEFTHSMSNGATVVRTSKTTIKFSITD